jgi:hypothetical protein
MTLGDFGLALSSGELQPMGANLRQIDVAANRRKRERIQNTKRAKRTKKKIETSACLAQGY